MKNITLKKVSFVMNSGLTDAAAQVLGAALDLNKDTAIQEINVTGTKMTKVLIAKIKDTISKLKTQRMETWDALEKKDFMNFGNFFYG